MHLKVLRLYSKTFISTHHYQHHKPTFGKFQFGLVVMEFKLQTTVAALYQCDSLQNLEIYLL